MANSDSSQYVLRYNEITANLEFGSANNWTPVTLAGSGGITQLTGDVTAGPGTGSQAATVVSVGGSTAASVHTSQLLTAGATSNPTPSTLVLRDSNGNSGFADLTVFNTLGAAATITVRSTHNTELTAVICEDDTDSNQAYFGIGNSNYGDPLVRQRPCVISGGLLQPFVIETLGCIMPLLTTTAKNAISSPVAGTVVYDTTLNKLSVFTGSVWETVTSS